MIKFLDLVSQYNEIKNEIDEEIKSVIETASFIGGERLSKFEDGFSNYCNVNHCVGVGNGTDALEIAIEALDLPKGSEILVPANSFIASSESVTRQGHKVVFCDVDKESYLICVTDIKKKISDNTKAIIAVHLYGHPCNMDDINKIAKENGLYIIEDCAQAHGAEYKGKRVGSIGDIGTFSFYPGKNLGAYGDGGAITTNNEVLAKKCRMIANHGRTGKYNHEFEGRNSRLDSLQAAILNVKLKYIERWTERRIQISNKYLESLRNIKQIKLPERQTWARQVYHLFVIRTEYRDELMDYLNENNIQTGIHYPVALSKLKAYEYCNQKNENMFANQSDSELLSLPVGEHLTDNEVDKIIQTIKNYFNV